VNELAPLQDRPGIEAQVPEYSGAAAISTVAFSAAAAGAIGHKPGLRLAGAVDVATRVQCVGYLEPTTPFGSLSKVLLICSAFAPECGAFWSVRLIDRHTRWAIGGGTGTLRVTD
jgi:hypothetical protein